MSGLLNPGKKIKKTFACGDFRFPVEYFPLTHGVQGVFKAEMFNA